jgi:site-specific DNA-methyltransferase (cytosine-N4-specific)
LRSILRAIEATKPAALRDVFRVILSDICREVSLQDPGDLRIRRRKDAAKNYPAVEMFVDSMRTKVASILRARQHVQPKKGTTQIGVLADTRDVDRSVQPIIKRHGKRVFDAAITSPPYATAMPYLDTQRLSLSLLNLITSRDLRRGEKTLIGNREIGDNERRQLEEQIRCNAGCLPVSPISFCRQLLELADDPSHGFRRRNVPALAYKYLTDMDCMFISLLKVMRSGGRFALLVGRNATELRGENVLIDTPQLLSDVAAARGWKVEESLPFETYHRFDVHQSNSIREEVLLVLRK